MALAIKGAQLLDGTGADPREDAVVRIEGDEIVAVGPPQRGDELIELDGCTILPGLIDAHVHLGLASSIAETFDGRLSAAERAADTFAKCARLLDEGFTTVRDVGGIDFGVLRALERRLVRGPRATTPGPILSQTGGHAHYAPPSTTAADWAAKEIPGLMTLSILCDGPEDVRRAAREAFRRGASFLKLNVTGGIVSVSDSLEDTQFTVAEIRAAVEEARVRGTYVAVHAHNNAGVRNALEAGATCIEHGTDLDEELAQELARRGVRLVPTLAVIHVLRRDYEEMGLTAEVGRRVGDAEARMRRAVRAAHDAGVTMGSGTDYIGPHEHPHGLELALKAQEIGAMAAIVSATSVNARVIGNERVGSLEAGKLADVVAVDFDPLAEPEAFADPARVRLVVQGGRVVKGARP
jgi:imidazolonepropionase-like amidohydrolase